MTVYKDKYFKEVRRVIKLTEIHPSLIKFMFMIAIRKIEMNIKSERFDLVHSPHVYNEWFWISPNTEVRSSIQVSQEGEKH